MDRSEPITWETRFDWTLTVLMLTFYGVAIFLSGFQTESRGRALIAALITGAYIVVVQAVPRHVRERRIVGEILAVSGVTVTLIAVALTDATNVGYILLVSVPVFFAAAFMGRRVGLETAALATLGLIGVLALVGESVVDRLQSLALILIIGIAFSEARRLLVQERSRSDALLLASELDSERLERLDAAHSLLVDLGNVATTSELSAVAVGERALLDLAAAVPLVASEVRTETAGGAVAAWGDADDDDDLRVYPISIEDRHLGSLLLWPQPGTNLIDYEIVIDATLYGVALAFDNILLLQKVARRSVQDERTRVARELHDDIGPALASMGLVIDMLVATSSDSHLTPQLRRLRREVTALVERVRSTVALLRREDTTTLSDHVHRIVAELGSGPPVLAAALDERLAPDGAVATEVGAILVEAVRNAARHSGADTISIEGVVDGENGVIRIHDDGKGFDPDVDYPGHFGLVGMRERAAAIGATLAISSSEGRGTTLAVQWGAPMTVPT